WLSQCISHECETKTESSYCPEYLINTSTLKLAPQVGICQYAALSYVWGGPEIPQLTLKDMKTIAPDQDSWSIGQHWESVPQTIKDAILLCQLLSIDYLWVDSLCILHERPDQKAFGDTHLARQMCDVYESAHLTIVGAAAKDSWAGLPGLRAGTRNTKQHTLQLGDVLLAVVQRSPREALESSIWNTRAWTFQESILSNRLIIFTDEHCFWSC
ncbi:heterokaryon incompatibility protein-domain-containing protein, partial [Truncatella angustata]